MNRQLYDSIVGAVVQQNYPLTVDSLQRQFPHVSPLTLGSILSQQRQRRARARSSVTSSAGASGSQRHWHSTALQRYAAAVSGAAPATDDWAISGVGGGGHCAAAADGVASGSGVLLKQAAAAGVSPAVLARQVLWQYLNCVDSEFRQMGAGDGGRNSSNNNSGGGGGAFQDSRGDGTAAAGGGGGVNNNNEVQRQFVNSLLRSTHRLYERLSAVAPATYCSLRLRSCPATTSVSADALAAAAARVDGWRLAEEVRRCVAADPCCGCSAEAAKHAVGVEYESRLARALRRCRVAFVDEHELRRRGYDKTPDVLLEIPVAVEGCVVNWIDSKALFGDDQSHSQYMQQQYVQYWRRYGPGLVIYWFGFLAELIPLASEQHVLLKDHFPEESLVFMQPELLAPAAPLSRPVTCTATSSSVTATVSPATTSSSSSTATSTTAVAARGGGVKSVRDTPVGHNAARRSGDEHTPPPLAAAVSAVTQSASVADHHHHDSSNSTNNNTDLEDVDCQSVQRSLLDDMLQLSIANE